MMSNVEILITFLIGKNKLAGVEAMLVQLSNVKFYVDDFGIKVVHFEDLDFLTSTEALAEVYHC